MPKVLMLAGDAGESLEVLYPYQRLLEEGYEVEIAAPSKKTLQAALPRSRIDPIPAPACTILAASPALGAGCCLGATRHSGVREACG